MALTTDRYIINKDGTIFDNKRLVYLKNTINNHGYTVVSLNINGKRKQYRVHRLVAKAFISNPENKTQVNHINGIKTDNRVENLEWVTASENVQHAYATGLKIGKGSCGEKNYKSKLTEKDVLEIRLKYEKKEATQNELASIYGVSRWAIRKILNKENWKHVN